MVYWESKADRGGRTPIRGEGQRGQRQSNPAPPRETTPPPNPHATQPPAPKGSPIAKKSARHAAQAWNTATVPELAVQVGTPLSLLPEHTLQQLTPCFDASLSTTSRPHSGIATPHRGPIVPRAGSSASWGPRLATFQSGRRVCRDLWSLAWGRRIPRSPDQIRRPRAPATAGHLAVYLPRTQGTHCSLPSNASQEGTKAFGISDMGCCAGKSYTGAIQINPKVPVRVLHRNGLYPCLEVGAQDTIWMMTCASLTSREDLKVLVKEGLIKICPPALVPKEYEAL